MMGMRFTRLAAKKTIIDRSQAPAYSLLNPTVWSVLKSNAALNRSSTAKFTIPTTAAYEKITRRMNVMSSPVRSPPIPPIVPAGVPDAISNADHPRVIAPRIMGVRKYIILIIQALSPSIRRFPQFSNVPGGVGDS